MCKNVVYVSRKYCVLPTFVKQITCVMQWLIAIVLSAHDNFRPYNAALWNDHTNEIVTMIKIKYES